MFLINILQRYYDAYMEKHRNLDYLEHELDKYRVSEEERKEEHDKKLKKMRERLLKEEVRVDRSFIVVVLLMLYRYILLLL